MGAGGGNWSCCGLEHQSAGGTSLKHSVQIHEPGWSLRWFPVVKRPGDADAAGLRTAGLCFRCLEEGAIACHRGLWKEGLASRRAGWIRGLEGHKQSWGVRREGTAHDSWSGEWEQDGKMRREEGGGKEGIK